MRRPGFEWDEPPSELERALLDAARNDRIPAALQARMAEALRVQAPPAPSPPAPSPGPDVRWALPKLSLWGSLGALMLVGAGYVVFGTGARLEPAPHLDADPARKQASVVRQSASGAGHSGGPRTGQGSPELHRGPSASSTISRGAVGSPNPTHQPRAPEARPARAGQAARIAPRGAGQAEAPPLGPAQEPLPRPLSGHPAGSRAAAAFAPRRSGSAHAADGVRHGATPLGRIPPPSAAGERSGASGEGAASRAEPSRAPAQRSPASGLQQELALLERARDALRAGAYPQAKRLLHEHGQRFSPGSLKPEADALRVQVLAAAGERAEARRLARRFLERYPAHPLARHVVEPLAQP